jgi:hypothetical protein
MKFSLILLIALFASIHVNGQALFDSIEDFGDIKRNWAFVKKDECFGLISKSGEIVLPPIYDDIANFNDYSRKLCLIKYHGKFGFINRKRKNCN